LELVLLILVYFHDLFKSKGVSVTLFGFLVDFKNYQENGWKAKISKLASPSKENSTTSKTATSASVGVHTHPHQAQASFCPARKASYSSPKANSNVHSTMELHVRQEEQLQGGVLSSMRTELDVDVWRKDPQNQQQLERVARPTKNPEAKVEEQISWKGQSKRKQEQTTRRRLQWRRWWSTMATVVLCLGNLGYPYAGCPGIETHSDRANQRWTEYGASVERTPQSSQITWPGSYARS